MPIKQFFSCIMGIMLHFDKMMMMMSALY